MSTIRLSVSAVALAAAASLAAPATAVSTAGTSVAGTSATATSSAPASTAPTPLPDLARAVGERGGVWAPSEMTVTRWGRQKNVWLSPQARLVAGTTPIEFRTSRTSYSQPVRTTWHRGEESGPVNVSQKNLRKLYGLSTISIRDANGTVLKERALGSCLAGMTSPARMDAPTTSPYPNSGCPWNPFALGMVHGVQAGWSIPLWENGLRIEARTSTLDMTITLGKAYADALGIPEADRSATTRVVVKRRGPGHRDAERTTDAKDPKAPNPELGPEPTTRAAGAPAGNEPDLRALPVGQVATARQGTLLRFETGVWNAGPGPLVVDGFREARTGSMTGYQQFYDANGDNAGHVRLGGNVFRMSKNGWEWRTNMISGYRLVDRSGRTVDEASRSSLCAANVEIVDATVPRAIWKPFESPFNTSCETGSAMSVRYSIATGMGDYSYRWSRAEALDISKVPQGWYRLEVIANPTGTLMEADKANNTTSRAIWLGPVGPRREVKVAPVGIVDDKGYRR